MPHQRATIVGMSGQFGQVFAGKLQDLGWDVGGIDTVGSAPDLITVEAGFSNPEADARLQASQLVLLCVPPEAVYGWLPHLAALLPETSLCLDILSVKSEVVKRASALSWDGEYLSLHPMFAPWVGFENCAVAAVPVKSGPLTEEFLTLIENWGSRVLRMSADDHDQATAVLQVGVHGALMALGRAAGQLGLDPAILEEMATPVSRPAFELLARITGGDAPVYEAIQQDHPLAREVRLSMRRALEELDEPGAVTRFFADMGKNKPG